MKVRIFSVLAYHGPFSVYVISLLWLFVAFCSFTIYSNREFVDLLILAALIAGIVLCYLMLWRIARHYMPPRCSSAMTWTPGGQRFTRWQRQLFIILLMCYLCIAVGHFIVIGFVPVIETWHRTTETSISLIRQHGYFDLPVWLRYASDYSTKALGPALLVVAYWYRSRLFWMVLVIGALYSLGLFARILPVLLLTPLIVFMLLQGRWLHALLACCLLGVLLTISTSLASPAIRDEMLASTPMQDHDAFTSESARESTAAAAVAGITEWSIQEPARDWRSTSAIYALYERMLFVPGQVIGQWFYYYRHPELREHGCGYRVLAPVFGCHYVPIPSKLYAVLYPDNIKAGMYGSLNAASFMFEYANFGPMGFFLSCLFAAALFILIMLVYRGHPLALPLNIPLIIVAMESSFITALGSGAGWLLTTMIFILFFRVKK